jgi:homoserine kinase type II
LGSYTKVGLTQASEILELYGLGPVSELSALSLGISNSNYRVIAEDGTWLLKISNDKGIEELKQEQEILTYLHERGYRYSLRPHRTLKGEKVYHYGQYFGVLFPFIEGIPPGPSDQTCRDIGQALGELHSLNHTSELHSLRDHNEVGFGAKEIVSYLDDKSCPQDFKDCFENVFPSRLKGFLDHDFERGIIHGDLYYDNTLFHQNRVCAVLDFEQSGRGEYLIDLGISLSGTCLEKGRVIHPLVDSFIQGYETVRKLSGRELEFLHDAICIGLFSIALWRIKRFTEGNLNPLMSDSYRELLQRAMSYRQTLSHQSNHSNKE